MVYSIILVAIAFYWLLKETDYLRVKLPIGAIPVIEIAEPIYKTWQELAPNSYQVKHWHPFFIRHPEFMNPLCGLDWLENTMHIVPEYKIVLEHSGVKHTMTIQDPSIIKNVVSAMKSKSKAHKVTKARRNKYGGLVVALPA